MKKTFYLIILMSALKCSDIMAADNCIKLAYTCSDTLDNNPLRDSIYTLILKMYHPKVFAKNANVNLQQIEKEAVQTYGETGERIIWDLKDFYYLVRFRKQKKIEDFNAWVESQRKFDLKYPTAIDVLSLNNDAWLIFNTSSNKKQLKIALSWSRKTIDKDPTANYYDTYGNLLYKLGRKREAILAMEKGLNFPLGNGELDSIKGNLEKMRQNKKTW